MRVALQPCGSPEGKANFRETVDNPVDLSTRTNLINPRHVDEIWNLYPPNGNARIWGVLGSLRKQWEGLSRGDLVLFLMDKKVVFSGRVGLKFENEELAKALWGMKGNGDTWELIYTLTGGQDLSIPKDEFKEAVGIDPADSIMGFRVLDEDKSARVLSELPGLVASAVTATENDYEESVDAERGSDPEPPWGSDPKFGKSEIRIEQPFIRKQLLKDGNRTCVFCGRTLMSAMLWAAHMKKRSKCTPEERKDWANLCALACKLGCDELYERGLIWVGDDSLIVVSDRLKELPEESAERRYALELLKGRKCLAHNESSECYFRWHREEVAKR
jgi:hypothetical protein